MFGSAALAAAVLPAALLTAVPVGFASESSSITLRATVASAGPKGEIINLTQNGKPVGTLKIKKCGEDSATTYFCSGKGTVPGVISKARVHLEWNCPVHKNCADHGNGTVKSDGSTEALVKVKASPVKATRQGSTYTVKLQLVEE